MRGAVLRQAPTTAGRQDDSGMRDARYGLATDIHR